MRGLKKQIDTLLQILDSTSIAQNANYNRIKAEIKEVVSDDKISPQSKKNLLKITHTTRALDTSMVAFLKSHNIYNNEYSLGQYLHKLVNHNNPDVQNLAESERSFFQTQIVDLRNSYMHSAGKICTDEQEVNELLSNMRTLLGKLANLG